MKSDVKMLVKVSKNTCGPGCEITQLIIKKLHCKYKLDSNFQSFHFNALLLYLRIPTVSLQIAILLLRALD